MCGYMNKQIRMPRKKKDPTLPDGGNSMKQLAAQSGIPIQHLKIVKVLCPEGFKANNGLDVKTVVDYYNANKDLVLQIETESLDNLKKIEKALKIQTDRLAYEKEKKLYITIAEEKEFLLTLVSTIQSILLAKLVNELQSKIETTPSDQRATIGPGIYNDVVKDMKGLVNKHHGNGGN